MQDEVRRNRQEIQEIRISRGRRWKWFHEGKPVPIGNKKPAICGSPQKGSVRDLMKRTPLLLAGIVAATILVVMGLGIFLTGSFDFMPSITVDAFGDDEIDENGIMVLTGTTNLGVNTFLLVNISGASPAGEKATSLASVLPGTGGETNGRRPSMYPRFLRGNIHSGYPMSFFPAAT